LFHGKFLFHFERMQRKEDISTPYPLLDAALSTATAVGIMVAYLHSQASKMFQTKLNLMLTIL
jgi:hypothetical protein